MKRTFIYGAFMLALLASCSKEEMVATSQNLANMKPLAVNVAVQGNTSSKAMIGATTTFKESVGVFIGGGTYANATAISKCDYGTSWVITAPIYLSSSIATVYGFYPYPSPTSDVSIGSKTLAVKVLAQDTFDGSLVADYMYATSTDKAVLATASNTANAINLFFRHAMAKLTFNIKKGANYPATSPGVLNQIELSSEVTGSLLITGNGTMDLSNGTISGITPVSPTSVKLIPKNAEVIQSGASGMLKPTTGSDFLAEVLVAPITLPAALGASTASSSNSIKLTLTVDDTPMSIFLPNASATATKWEQGKNYVYTVTVQGKQLEINPTVTVVGFTSGGSFDLNDIK